MTSLTVEVSVSALPQIARWRERVVRVLTASLDKATWKGQRQTVKNLFISQCVRNDWSNFSLYLIYNCSQKQVFLPSLQTVRWLAQLTLRQNSNETSTVPVNRLAHNISQHNSKEDGLQRWKRITGGTGIDRGESIIVCEVMYVVDCLFDSEV